MSRSDELYAAPAQRWVDDEYIVVTGRSPWARHVLDRGVIGEHARWLMDRKRPESMQRAAWGVETVIRAP
jgi:hypothetical protein